MQCDRIDTKRVVESARTTGDPHMNGARMTCAPCRIICKLYIVHLSISLITTIYYEANRRVLLSYMRFYTNRTTQPVKKVTYIAHTLFTCIVKSMQQKQTCSKISWLHWGAYTKDNITTINWITGSPV